MRKIFLIIFIGCLGGHAMAQGASLISQEIITLQQNINALNIELQTCNASNIQSQIINDQNEIQILSEELPQVEQLDINYNSTTSQPLPPI